jgi:CubicO group peptidase (beta-lactamase class C family)
MTHRLPFRAAAILCLTGFLLPAAGQADDVAAKIEELVGSYHEAGQFNGAALVAKGGKIVFKKGYGQANMEWGIPNTPSTKFRLGSVTKQFTAMVIMQLVAEGRIDVQKPMTAYLPQYRKDTGDKVTVHHLLTHTSGIPSYTGLPEFMRNDSRDAIPVDDFVEKFCSGDLEFEPGSRFKYNNSGYYLLGAIVEQVTGKKYEQAVRERIFEPLGMNGSGYDRHGPITERRAAGYQGLLGVYVNAPYLDMGAPFAAGALYSTVEDLYKWDQALYTDRLLPERFAKAMFTPFKNNYAYGWGVRRVAGADGEVTRHSHGGGINGFSSQILRVVEDRHLIVLLNNTGRAPLANITREIMNILYGRPFKLAEPSELDATLKRVLVQGADAVAKAHRERGAEAPEIPEDRVNAIGYQLLEAGRVEDAIEVFRFNVAMHPESSNVYDSLGEAYAAAGRTEAAIRNYERALELDPESTTAPAMLEKLRAAGRSSGGGDK